MIKISTGIKHNIQQYYYNDIQILQSESNNATSFHNVGSNWFQRGSRDLMKIVKNLENHILQCIGISQYGFMMYVQAPGEVSSPLETIQHFHLAPNPDP